MGVDINCRDGEGLINAINWNKERVYNILLERPELDLRLARWRDGGTPLHRAAIQCYPCKKMYPQHNECSDLIDQLIGSVTISS